MQLLCYFIPDHCAASALPSLYCANFVSVAAAQVLVVYAGMVTAAVSDNHAHRDCPVLKLPGGSR